MIEEEIPKNTPKVIDQQISKWVFPILERYKANLIPGFSNHNSVHFTFKSSIENCNNLSINAAVERWNSTITINLFLCARFPTSNSIELDYCSIFDAITLFNTKELFSAIKFYYNEEKKQITAQQMIPIFNLFEQPNYVLYFCKSFQKLVNKLEELYSHIFSEYMSSFHELKREYSDEKKNYMLIIKHLKQFYEKSRIKKQKSTKSIDLSGSSIKWVDLAQEIQQTFGTIRNFKSEKESYDQLTGQKCFTNIFKAYEEKTREDKVSQKERIVKTVDIQDEKELEVLQTNGAFGVLKKTQLFYVLKESAFQSTSEELSKYKSKSSDEEYGEEEKLIKKDIVISKKALQKQEDSFFNEKAILLGLRNEYSDKIAQYFFQVAQDPHYNEKIYSKCYPKILDFSKVKTKYWFKIINDIVKGIEFLQSCSLIHRDLKPSNILISEQYQSKIIDFGSACPMYRSARDQKWIDFKLKSTRNYYRPYHTLPMSITRKFTKEQYEQHFNFDIFSYGCIIEKAISCPSGFDPFILDTLKYIMKKCLETNPEDRLCAMEIIALLQYLSEYKRKE